MGFLCVGRRFLNNKNDIIDDRIDVVMRTTMALTVACARCHDHKFDPIPTADYYSIAGVFEASTEKLLPIGPPLRSSSVVSAIVSKSSTIFWQKSAVRPSPSCEPRLPNFSWPPKRPP